MKLLNVIGVTILVIGGILLGHLLYSQFNKSYNTIVSCINYKYTDVVTLKQGFYTGCKFTLERPTNYDQCTFIGYLECPNGTTFLNEVLTLKE